MSEYALAISDEEIARYLFMAERARLGEADLWRRAGIGPGAVVADVGCGPAAVSVELARSVGLSGRVIGVERDPAALAAARALVARTGIQTIELREGTATATGIDPGSVDVVVMRHVLAHNGPVEQDIVDHVASLLRPGGHAYLLDIFGPGLAIVGIDPDAEDIQERYADFHAGKGNDLRTGLRLGQLLEAAGLEVVTFEGSYEIVPAPVGVRPPAWAARESMLAAGTISSDDVDRWAAAFARTDANPQRPTMFMPRFVAIGRRPA